MHDLEEGLRSLAVLAADMLYSYIIYAGRLRDLEEGLRSLAVSHSHLKVDYESKLQAFAATVLDLEASS